MADWKNRIVGHGEVDPLEIVANPRNWRIHPMGQSKALEGVLREIGWIAPVTLNRTTGFCLDGHLRVALAVKRRAATVPVQYVELSEEEEAIALATLDPLGAMASTDKGKLQDVLATIQAQDAEVQRLLAQVAEKAVSGAADRSLEEIDLDELPERPIWVLCTISAEQMAKAGDPLDQLRALGARVEVSDGA